MNHTNETSSHMEDRLNSEGSQGRQPSNHAKHDAGPRKAIGESYECLKKIVDLDTKSTTTALGVPEAANNAAILKYRDLEGYIDELVENCDSVRQSDARILKTSEQLDTLEKRVDHLEQLTDQLDRWSSQLEASTRKYRDDRPIGRRKRLW